MMNSCSCKIGGIKRFAGYHCRFRLMIVKECFYLNVKGLSRIYVDQMMKQKLETIYSFDDTYIIGLMQMMLQKVVIGLLFARMSGIKEQNKCKQETERFWR